MFPCFISSTSIKDKSDIIFDGSHVSVTNMAAILQTV